MDYTDCTGNPALFAKCILERKPAYAEIKEDDEEGVVTLDYNEERGEKNNLIICWGDYDSIFPGLYREKDFPKTWGFLSEAQEYAVAISKPEPELPPRHLAMPREDGAVWNSIEEEWEPKDEDIV